MLKKKLNDLFRWQGGIILILLVFFLLSLISHNVFFSGFIENFERINFFVFGNRTPSFLHFIPFYSKSILLSALLHPYFLLGLILVYLPLILMRKKLLQNEFIYDITDKILVFVPAFILTWEVVTFDYNYFLNSAFYFDRLLLIALTFLMLRFPLVTPLFIAFAMVYRSQYNYPIGGFDLFDKNILFDILIMFVAYRYIKATVPDFKIPFTWLVLCIFGANYFYSGITKLTIAPHAYEWLFQNNISDLFVNCHLRGWLAKASGNTIHSIWNFFNTFHVPFQILSFVVEVSAIFILRNRKLAIVILSSAFLMHIAILFCGSVLFWKWMALDLVLIVLLITKRMDNIFAQNFFIISILVILSSPIWLKPLRLAWFDTQVNQYFTYEVEDDKGIIYQLEKNEMNPYHQWFQYDRFLWLVDKKCLPLSGFGFTSKYKLFKSLKDPTPEKLQILETDFGTNSYDEEKIDKYEDFVKKYFHNRNARLNDKFFPARLSAPEHLHNTWVGLLYKNQAPVKKFRVFYNLTISSGEKSDQIEKTILKEIIVD